MSFLIGVQCRAWLESNDVIQVGTLGKCRSWLESNVVLDWSPMSCLIGVQLTIGYESNSASDLYLRLFWPAFFLLIQNHWIKIWNKKKSGLRRHEVLISDKDLKGSKAAIVTMMIKFMTLIAMMMLMTLTIGLAQCLYLVFSHPLTRYRALAEHKTFSWYHPDDPSSGLYFDF
jgi:hypothetical protein